MLPNAFKNEHHLSGDCKISQVENKIHLSMSLCEHIISILQKRTAMSDWIPSFHKTCFTLK